MKDFRILLQIVNSRQQLLTGSDGGKLETTSAAGDSVGRLSRQTTEESVAAEIGCCCSVSDLERDHCRLSTQSLSSGLALGVGSSWCSTLRAVLCCVFSTHVRQWTGWSTWF